MKKGIRHFTDATFKNSPNYSSNEESVTIGVDVLTHPSNYNEESQLAQKFSSNTSLRSNSSVEKGKLFGGTLSYMQEWQTICCCKDLNEFRSWAFDGLLAACRFRAVCWRVYLDLFPSDSSKWRNILRSDRERYESLRRLLMVTPGAGDPSLDPVVNNPLSQDTESPWNQYFEDSELKKLIRLDVQRTFPEVDFFQSKRVEEMMVSILFCYARKYPDVSYVQGMHEILAPLCFLVNYDHHVYRHSDKPQSSNDMLQELMDEAYLEHDSFVMFEKVMEKLHPWYEDGPGDHKSASSSAQKAAIVTQPFARPQDIGATTKIVRRLARVHDHILLDVDPAVHAHLDKLEIPPQVYGIRWTRLMFGREFSFTDVLMLWDAIFADSAPAFSIIEYLVVAMLSAIRDRLLAADYVTSLNLLMRYPSSSDVQSIMQLALYFRNPKTRREPARCASLPKVQTVGGQPNVHRAPQQPSAHIAASRSTSLPRAPSVASASSAASGATSSMSIASLSSASSAVPTLKSRSLSAGINGRAADAPRTALKRPGSAASYAGRSTHDSARASGRKGGRGVGGAETAQAQPFDQERPMAELKEVSRCGECGVSSSRSPTLSEATTVSYKCGCTGCIRGTTPCPVTLRREAVRCETQLRGFATDLRGRLGALGLDSDGEVNDAIAGFEKVAEALGDLSLRLGSRKAKSSATAESSRESISHPLMNDEES